MGRHGPITSARRIRVADSVEKRRRGAPLAIELVSCLAVCQTLIDEGVHSMDH